MTDLENLNTQLLRCWQDISKATDPLQRANLIILMLDLERKIERMRMRGDHSDLRNV
jgi:hypothetical protein